MDPRVVVERADSPSPTYKKSVFDNKQAEDFGSLDPTGRRLVKLDLFHHTPKADRSPLLNAVGGSGINIADPDHRRALNEGGKILNWNAECQVSATPALGRVTLAGPVLLLVHVVTKDLLASNKRLPYLQTSVGYCGTFRW